MKKLPCEIVYEDRDILVVYKPAGVPVQTGRIGGEDLESALKNYLAAKGEAPELAVVHRLDQPVCGLLVFGKNKKAGAKLSAMVQEKAVSEGKGFGKKYLAVVLGTAPKEPVVLEDDLVREPKGNLSRIAKPGEKGAKRARLRVEACPRQEEELPADFSREWMDALRRPDTALVQVVLYTGRHHQIRVQLAGAGMPILGDAKYGGSGEGSALKLCAACLEFSHPVTGKRMHFSCVPHALSVPG